MCLEIDDQFKRKNDVYGDPYPVKNRRNCDSHDLVTSDVLISPNGPLNLLLYPSNDNLGPWFCPSQPPLSHFLVILNLSASPKSP